jgi:hypothetical protein
MSGRNREVGHNLERKLFQLINRRTIASQQGMELTENELSNKDLEALPESNFILLPKLGSTRKLSRDMDKKKKDITPEDMDRLYDFPYILQAKSLAVSSAPYAKLLAEIKKNNKWGIPVIIHEQTEKTKTKTNKTVFKVRDDFAIMYRKHFIDMMFRIAELEFELKQREFHEKV